jgi:hypothetical protein
LRRRGIIIGHDPIIHILVHVLFEVPFQHLKYSVSQFIVMFKFRYLFIFCYIL